MDIVYVLFHRDPLSHVFLFTPQYVIVVIEDYKREQNTVLRCVSITFRNDLFGTHVNLR